MSHFEPLPREDMEWTTEPHEPGWLGRLIAPHGGGKPATAAFLIGIAGAAAFAGSLAFDWQSVTPPADTTTSSTDGLPFGDSLANVFMLGLVYAMSGVALLGLLGAVVTRPDLALRLRMPAAGVTVGLVGILVAATIRMPDYLMAQIGIDPRVSATSAGVTFSYEPGIFFAYAAVVLPMVAIWLAARTAVRAAQAATADAAAQRRSDRDAAARHAVEATGAADITESHWPPMRGEGSRGLSVLGSEPLDLTVSPDAWPR